LGAILVESSGRFGQKNFGQEIVRTEMEIRVLVFWRRKIVRSSVGAAVAVAAISVGVMQAGCESTPVRAFRGARHYTAGTEALERNDDALAIAELEQAAVLVPHASEIQNHLGIAYWSDGRPQSAQVAFEKAIELDCDNDVARANLAQLMRSDDLEGHADSDADNVADNDTDDDAVVAVKVEDTNRVDENGE
jgi:tetratricopeptide (TPR) repeat protein